MHVYAPCVTSAFGNHAMLYKQLVNQHQGD